MKRVLVDMEKHHHKQLTFMRGMLDGMGFYKVLEALEFACRLDEGKLRKDGQTPRFHHQLQVARLLSTLLPHMLKPEDTLIVAFLHDVLEDHHDIVGRTMLDDQFGRDVGSAVWKLSKKMGGITKTPQSYFEEVSRCPVSSLVKCADRIHNNHTMQGAFSREKQEQYVRELDDWFFPMLKAARHNFPRQYAAYENLKILLLCQQELLYHVLDAKVKDDDE